MPRVILHNAVSLDGRITGFEPDIGLFYRLAGTWAEDATLAGSETVALGAAREGIPDDDPSLGALPAPGESSRADAPAATDDPPSADESAATAGPEQAPLLVIPDSRGRVRCWSWLLDQPYWSRGVALCSRITPEEHRRYLERVGVEMIIVGEDRVDLRAALERLREDFGVRRIRVDGGGRLNGALLSAGLVDEISLLVHPVLAGDATSTALYHPPEPESGESPLPLPLQPLDPAPQEGGLIWLRYRVLREGQG
jgi:2,5-diamino-6-(ribosylamino)-4(3H)-pyrimidinone 5'-phosphate reductase